MVCPSRWDMVLTLARNVSTPFDPAELVVLLTTVLLMLCCRGNILCFRSKRGYAMTQKISIPFPNLSETPSLKSDGK